MKYNMTGYIGLTYQKYNIPINRQINVAHIIKILIFLFTLITVFFHKQIYIYIMYTAL